MAESVTVTGTVQREAWLARSMPPVEQLGTDLWSVPIPIPENPLRYTLVYVLGSDSGLTLIDTGTDTDGGWQDLLAGLGSFGASVRDVTGCLVTHFHPDHLGLAGRLRSEVGAWVGMHPADVSVVNRLDALNSESGRSAWLGWLTSLGAPYAEAVEIMNSRTGLASELVGDPERLIEDGDLIDVPGWQVRAVHTPGHTPGHLCFVDDSADVLFAGDHLLPRISPNISADRHNRRRDVLADFLASLDKVAKIEASEVLPAHEWRFRGVPARVAQLHRHHEDRLAELLELVRRSPGAVPWELAGEMTWSRPWAQYGGTMRLSAVGETTAHLVHLVRRGDVIASNDHVPRYTAAATADET